MRGLVLCALLSVSVRCNDEVDHWDDSPGFLKRSHSLISPFSGNLPLWELKGDSMATAEYIRLTSDQQSKNGAIWSRVVSPYFINYYYLVSKYSRSHSHGGRCSCHTGFMARASPSLPMAWACSSSRSAPNRARPLAARSVFRGLRFCWTVTRMVARLAIFHWYIN